MSTPSGKIAEKAAAKFLKSKGYEVVAMNWRRPRCEIDIVAIKKTKKGFFKTEKVYHFVEVKYRRVARQGTGIDYITPKKLEQMKFAARMWVAENSFKGSYELSAVEVSGDDFEVTMFLPQIDT